MRSYSFVGMGIAVQYITQGAASVMQGKEGFPSLYFPAKGKTLQIIEANFFQTAHLTIPLFVLPRPLNFMV